MTKSDIGHTLDQIERGRQKFEALAAERAELARKIERNVKIAIVCAGIGVSCFVAVVVLDTLHWIGVL